MNEFYDWWLAQVEAEADKENVADADSELDRWADDGGSYTTVETTKFGDAEPSSIRIYEPGRKTLGELVDEKINLSEPVSEGTQVSVIGEGRYSIIVVVRAVTE